MDMALRSGIAPQGLHCSSGHWWIALFHYDPSTERIRLVRALDGYCPVCGLPDRDLQARGWPSRRCRGDGPPRSSIETLAGRLAAFAERRRPELIVAGIIAGVSIVLAWVQFVWTF